jgi:hypothetical protein
MPSPVAASTLPRFSNMRAVCARCGARWGIRMHFDRDCALVRGDHFHRICRCGHRWVERTSAQHSATTRLDGE